MGVFPNGSFDNDLYLIRNIKVYLNADLIIDFPVVFTFTNWLIEANKTIHVNSDLFITSFMDSQINGCDYLWEGFKVGANTRFGFSHTTIRDAKTVVDLDPFGMNLDIRDSYLENNVNGLVHYRNVMNVHNLAWWIQRTTFRTTANLKPELNGNSYDQLGRIGIRISNAGCFVTGCNFEDLRIGVYSTNSTLLTIAGSTFNSTNSFPDIPKTGVFVRGAGSLTNIRDTDFTDLTNSVSYVGLNRLSTLRVWNTDFSHDSNNCASFMNGTAPQVSHIRASNANQTNIRVSDNNFVLKSHGSSIEISGGVAELEVLDNDFDNYYFGCVNHSARILQSHTGIKRFQNNDFKVYFTPHNFKMAYNIQGVNSRNLRFFDNDHSFINNFGESAAAGYTEHLFQTVNNSLFGNNTINNAQTAYTLLLSGTGSKNKYCCNESLHQGSSYFVRDESFSDLLGNMLYGLDLGHTAVIGPQINHHNVWSGTANFARMDNPTELRIFANIFEVNPQVPGSIPLIIFPMTIEDDWFRDTGSGTYDCSTLCIESELEEEGNNSPPGNGPGNPDPDHCEKACEQYNSIIAMIEDTTIAYPDQRLWQALVNLYRSCGAVLYSSNMCDNDPVVVVDPVLPDWVDTEDDITDISTPNEDIMDEAIVLLAQLELLNEEYEQLLEEEDPNDPSSEFINCTNSIIHITQTLDSLSDIGIQFITQKAQNALVKVNNLTTPHDFLVYRKEVWKICLKQLIEGDTSLTENDKSYLRTVSQLCPSEFGPVVYEAVSVLMSIGEHYDEDAYVNCEYENLKIRNSNLDDAADSKLLIYPNPVSDVLNIEYSESKEDIQFKLMNNVGNLIYKVILPAGSSYRSLDVSHLAGGVYFYVMESQSEIYNNGKLIIIR